MQNHVRISVVIPVHNRASLISAALESVLEQNYPVHEVIVVDDGSTDDTARVVLDHAAAEPRLKYVIQPNGGAGAARNKGIELASAEWIAFLDSDDVWTANKLQNAVALIEQSENVEFVHSNRQQLRPDGTMDEGRTVTPDNLVDKQFLLASFGIKTSTVLMKRSLAQSLDGLFLTTIRTCEDYEFFWRAVAQARAVGYVPSCDAIIRWTDDGLSRRINESSSIRDNIAAMGSAAKWMLRREFKDYAATLYRRQRWEYRRLFVSTLCAKNFAHLRRDLASCLRDQSVLGTFRVLMSAFVELRRPDEAGAG